MSEQSIKDALNKIIDGLCSSRKRHDRLILRCVQDTRQSPMTGNPIQDFSTYLTRRLLKNESVVINMITITALFAKDPHVIVPENGLQLLQGFLRKQPPAIMLESQPILNITTLQPILLVISRHAFRTLEISRDISLAMNPNISPENRERGDYLANCAQVSENLTHMGIMYSDTDIIDCLHVISEEGAFFLRGGFLFQANIEPLPFVDKLEGKGFIVSVLLDEYETNEEFAEHDFLKRFRGLLVSKSQESQDKAIEHIDFLEELTRLIPLPTVDLAKPINIG